MESPSPNVSLVSSLLILKLFYGTTLIAVRAYIIEYKFRANVPTSILKALSKFSGAFSALLAFTKGRRFFYRTQRI